MSITPDFDSPKSLTRAEVNILSSDTVKLQVAMQFLKEFFTNLYDSKVLSNNPGIFLISSWFLGNESIENWNINFVSLFILQTSFKKLWILRG